jgi:hypothetical protein
MEASAPERHDGLTHVPRRLRSRDCQTRSWKAGHKQRCQTLALGRSTEMVREGGRLSMAGHYAEAEPVLRKALAMKEAVLGPQSGYVTERDGAVVKRRTVPIVV